MKTCQECGNFMDDKETICPDCGARVASAAPSSGLSLKSKEEPVKKKKSGNPMGTSMNTGSGLTDILRADMIEEDTEAEAEDKFYGGSIPVSMSKLTIDEEYSYKKQKSIMPGLIKLIFLAAIAFGIYNLVTKVLLADDELSTKDAAFNLYIDVVEGKSDKSDDIYKLVPAYADSSSFEECSFFDYQGSVTGYNILETTYCSTQETDLINSIISLDTGKTPKITDACILEVQLTVNGKIIKQEMLFVQIRGSWYLNPDNIRYTE